MNGFFKFESWTLFWIQWKMIMEYQNFFGQSIFQTSKKP